MKDKSNNESIKWLESLSKDDLLCIIKYGLRGWPTAPADITVDDIYEAIGCQYIYELM